jgi:hypothetical protein
VAARFGFPRRWAKTSAFRTFSYNFLPRTRGKETVTARATNKIGQTQTSELIHNPAGYHHNVMHSVTFNVA